MTGTIHLEGSSTVFAKPHAKANMEHVPKRRRPERTPDQIARKRDQDREAQRLSRERTRRRIEEAENRLAETEAAASNFEQDLKHAIKERDVARQASHELRSQLDSACAQLDAARAQLATVAHILDMNGIKPPDPVTTFAGPHCLSLPEDHIPQLQSPQPSENMHSHKSPVRSERLSIRHMANHSASPDIRTHKHLGQRTVSYSGSSAQSSPSYITEGSIYGSETSFNLWQDDFSKLPKNGPLTCPMDNILTIFSNSRRELLRQGEPEDVVLGPANPTLCVLPSLRRRHQVGMGHPVSQMLAEVMNTAQVLQALPEQIAVLWLTHISLRWNILPNKANWDALPEYVRPMPSQLLTPHPVWIDHLPWPEMRSILAQRHTEYPQDDFFLPWCEGLSVNWPYESMECFITDRATDQLVISPAFENHIRNLDNWSLGPGFARALPSLVGTYRQT